jgi:undecaprenyl-diphosphatase
MKRLLASCFGLGWLPLAPGTYGSVPPVIIFLLLVIGGASAAMTAVTMAVLVLAGSAVCILCAPAVIAISGKNDPREVVADEFAGQALTFLIVALIATSRTWLVAAGGFVLFRLFDITKPWPVRKIEKLPKGWGILADDLLAAVYAAIGLAICLNAGRLFHAGRELNVLTAVILGVIQGLTEFLPVSSSGHLVLLETLFGFDAAKQQMLLFDLTVHIGTVAAIFIVFRKSIAAFCRNLSAFGKYGTNPLTVYRRSPAVHIAVLAAAATAVTAVIGILFENYFKSARGSLAIVGLMWVINGTLLLLSDRRKKTRLGLRRFGIIAVVIVGLAQAAAIMPGISRSGATICAAILIGLHRRWAVEFSFLLAIPAILGAMVMQLAECSGRLDFAALGPGAAGLISAMLAGILALKALIRIARSANLKPWAFYCYALAGFVTVYLLSKV